MLEPTRPKGPPLNALRAFESAARLGGFAAAAGELCVTPAAVTQHIKTLEAWAGAPLFERRSQGVKLTPLGESALQEFGSAFDQLGAAVRKLRARAAPQEVRIAALPSIAQLWLSPRLQAIHRALPNVKISITAMESPPNLLREAFDLSLFFCEPPFPTQAIDICGDEIFPVCSPALAGELQSPADLAKFPLLQDSTLVDDWRSWITAVEPQLNFTLSGPTYSLYSLALEEAKNGAGVLIGHTPLVEDALNNGVLVEPFSQRIPVARSLVVMTGNYSTESDVLNTMIEAMLAS